MKIFVTKSARNVVNK